MPQGKGTYGSQVGRPSKKKYNTGGNVDPFSTRNPEGVPAEQMAEAMENQGMANEGQEGQEGQEELPTSNAQERSQMSPDVEQYNKGGKVKSTEDYMKTDYKKYEEHHQREIKKKVKSALEGKGNITDVVKATEASKEDRDWYIPRMKMLDAKKKKKGKKK